MKKGFVLIVVMMAISTVAYAQWQCNGVTCQPGMGPYYKDICFYDQNNNQVNMTVCYCFQGGLSPALSIQKVYIDAGQFQVPPADASEYIYWAAFQIYSEYVVQYCGNKYPCTSPTPPQNMDFEVWDCWNWALETISFGGHVLGEFWCLSFCGERVCTYIWEGSCYYDEQAGKCCAGAVRVNNQVWEECEKEECNVKGCNTYNYGSGQGRLCNPVCVE
jgi:hypothetical protein